MFCPNLLTVAGGLSSMLLLLSFRKRVPMMIGPGLLTFVLLVAGAHAGSYLIAAPSTVYRGSVLDLTVDILNTTGVDIEATLQYYSYNASERRNVIEKVNSVRGTFGRGPTGTLSMPVSTDLNCPGCQLHIRARGGLQFERNLPMRLSNTVVSVLVQTDKAIYKPGQIVRYRAFAVYPDLQIYMGNLNINIKDPKGNKVKVSRGESGPSGVVEGQLVLSDQPIFGQWSLFVELNETRDHTTQYFDVADYQLPRFEVTVELPPYGLTRETTLSGTVKAKYTFGQPVKGMVELHLGPNQGPDFCGKPLKTTQVAFEIDGEAKFRVPTSDIQRAVSLYNGVDVRVTALVKEAATGVRLNGSSVIKYHSNEFKIEFLENTPSVFKPGLPYKAFLRASSPDNLPPPGENNVVSVYTSVSYRLKVKDQDLYDTNVFTGTYPLPGQNLTLPANGVIAVDVEIPNNATSITMKATFKDQTARRVVEKTYSKSKTYMQLTALEKNIKAKSKASFNLRATEPLGRVTYEVLSRGSVAFSGSLNGKGQTSVNFELDVTPAMAPTGHLLAYYNRGNKEVVADSLAFSVDGIFQNEVSIDFSVNKSEPHRNISVQLTADANSTVNVLAVDQSVLLLKTGNDITAEKVEKAVSSFDAGEKPDSPEYALSYSAASVDQVFQKTGLSFITDVQMTRPRPPSVNRLEEISFRGLPQNVDSNDDIRAYGRRMTKMGGASGMESANAQVQSVERVRTVFPEAWLFESANVSADGKANIRTTVPDTITSWVASAFATNPLSGLGVAPTTAKLQVFRPFFVSLTYPSTVTRNEQLVIQATVFNYLPRNQDVTVTLKSSENFESIKVLEDGTEVQSTTDIVQRVRVRSEGQGVVYFPVLATEIGVANVEVAAQSNNAADAVRRQIYVQAEGAPVSFNYPVFINNKGRKPFKNVIDLPLPPSVVQGSETARVKATGDLLGSSLDNLDSLLALPTGCGEQSIVKFAPDLYIYRYLQVTSQLTEYYDRMIVGYLESGYQRQLTYQRTDGGFSAFGDRDESGSTWLTALVARTFSEAKNTIYVDDQVLKRAVDWLLDRQSRDGSFSEFGQVLDRNVQGNEGGPALTATVLLALQQNSDVVGKQECEAIPFDCLRYNKWTNSTRDAVANLEGQLDSMSDLFPLALTTFALSVSGSSRAGDALEKLNARAQVEGGLQYWAANATVTPPNSPTPRLFQRGSAYLSSWSPPRVQARPIDILTTSYAVLAYVTQGSLDAGLPAVRWLTTQRNALGGFASTQDTTVALQALSAYASKARKEGSNLKVKVMSDKSEVVNFEINNDNALVLQTKEFQNVPGQVDITATGSGMALVEVDYRFNVDSELSTPSFDVSTVLLDDQLNQFNLMVCTKWLWDRKTGMVVQEIGIPSGFEPDLSSLSDVAGLKRAERRGNTVHVYFDEITKTSLCYSVFMSRKAKVARSERNYVKTFDYYEPADQSTVFYQPRHLKESTICDVCDRCCQ
ncbi:CD109 antigen [Aplysia californica]|uniref:CD109 antigen n=1 Tax=Aplysia californica TaxID=6500 RepID=A0ABM1AFZ5_APLCA|nr:CD109 antigen [Aplysia californica]